MTKEIRDSRIFCSAAASIMCVALSACGSADTPEATAPVQSDQTPVADAQPVDSESKPIFDEAQLAQMDSDRAQGKATRLGNNLAIAKTRWLDWSNKYTGVHWQNSSSAMIVPPPPRGKNQTIARMSWTRTLEPGSYYFHMHIPSHLNSTTRSEAVLFFNDGYGRIQKISANSRGYGGRWVYVNKRTRGFQIQLQSGWKATNTERVRVFLRKGS